MYNSLTNRLSCETLIHLSVELEMTDKKIAKLYGVDRTSIVHMRKRYNIPARLGLGRKGELFVLEQLQAFGFEVEDLNIKDKLASYDILVNNEVRIEVKTSSANAKDGNYRFALSEQITNGNITGKNRIFLDDGRTRKLYRKTCDYMVFVCWDSKSVFIVPSDKIPDTQGNVGISENTKRFRHYKNNWESLKGLVRIGV